MFKILICSLLLALSESSQPLTESQLPGGMQSWINWVKYDNPTLSCHRLNGSSVCLLYDHLTMKIDNDGATFELSGVNRAYNWQSVQLPGEARSAGITLLNSNQAAVLADGKWHTMVPPGPFVVKGSLKWKKMPEAISIPENVALLNVTREGKVLYPTSEDSAHIRLFTDKPKVAAVPAEKQELPPVAAQARLQVIHHVQMARPMKVDTVYNFSCPQKEQYIPLQLNKGFLLESLSSNTSIIQDGDSLNYSCPQGRSSVTLSGRLALGTKKLATSAASADNVVVESEVIVFSPAPERWENDLAVTNGIQIEASQIPNLPASWVTNLSTVWKLMENGQLSWTTSEINQLGAESALINLERTVIATDLPEKFYVYDMLSVSDNKLRNLAMTEAGMVVNGITVDGRASLIYQNEQQQPMAALNAPNQKIEFSMWWEKALSGLFPVVLSLPTAGYDHDIMRGRVILRLLPGWVPLMAWGAEDYTGDYMRALSLYTLLLGVLAFVLVYVACWSISKKWLRWLVAVASLLVTVTAPWLDYDFSLIWLIMIGLLMIIRLMKKIAAQHRDLYKWTVILLGLAVIPLFVTTVAQWPSLMRSALHPALDRDNSAYSSSYSNSFGFESKADAARASRYEEAEEYMADEVVRDDEPQTAKMERAKTAAPKMAKAVAPSNSLGGVPAEAAVALPSVLQAAPIQAKQIKPVGVSMSDISSGKRIIMSYMNKKCDLKVLLIPPFWRALAIIMHILLSIFTLLMIIGVNKSWIKKGTTAAALLLLLVPGPALAADNDWPDQDLLDELAQKISPVKCEGVCQQIHDLDIAITSEGTYQFTFEVSSVTTDLVALPGPWYMWRADEILVKGQPALTYKSKDSNYLYALCPAGRAKVVVKGRLLDSVNPRLMLPVAVSGMTLKSASWRLDIDPATNFWAPQTAVALLSVNDNEPSEKVEEKKAKDDAVVVLNQVNFARRIEITRTLKLSQQNTVQTFISAVGLKAGELVDIPLLDGEVVSALTDKIHNNKIQLTAYSPNLRFNYSSTLPQRETFEIQAAADDHYLESWQVNCADSWNCQTSLKPLPGGKSLTWTFEPDPGEKMTITAKELPIQDGVDGEGNKWMLNVRNLQGTMSYSLGGVIRLAAMEKVTIEIPAEAVVTSFSVNGASNMTRPEKGILKVLLGQGYNRLNLEYTVSGAVENITTIAPVKCSLPITDFYVTYDAPERQVVLATFGDTVHKPAVLFWSSLVAHILLAILIFFFCRRLLPDLPMKLYQWILLLVPLAAISSYMILALVIPMILLALPLKPHDKPRWGRMLLLILLLLCLVIALISASSMALVERPDMNIVSSLSSYDMSWMFGYLPARSEMLSVGTVSISLTAWKVLQFIWCVWLIWLCKGWYGLLASRFVAALHRDPNAVSADKDAKKAKNSKDNGPNAAKNSEQKEPSEKVSAPKEAKEKETDKNK